MNRPLMGTAFWLLTGKSLPDLARWMTEQGFGNLSLHPFIIDRDQAEREELAAAMKTLKLSLTYHGNVTRQTLDKNALDTDILDSQLNDCLWWHRNAAPVSCFCFDSIHLPESPYFSLPWNVALVRHAHTRLAPAGIRTGIENVYGPTEKYQSLQDIRDFLSASTLPDQGILLDAAHTNIHLRSGNDSKIRTMEDYISGLPLDILDLHVSDNHGEKDEHKYLGYGNLDLAGLCRGLKAVGYPGPVTLEICKDIQTGKYGVDITRPEEEKWYLDSRDLFLKTWEQTA